MSYCNWYYKWNDGSYRPYDNNVTQWLNNANVGEDTIMVIYGNKYKITRISPQDCTQKNLKSGGQRRGINQQKYNQLHNQNNNNNNNNYESHNERSNNNYHQSQNINENNNNCQQQWYWQDNNGSFKRFQNNISSEINKLQIGQCYMLNIGQSQYEIRKISNTKCAQRNVRTNFSRNVFAKPANNSKNNTSQKQHKKNNTNKYKWFWKDNSGNLKQYPHSIAVEIEALKIDDVHFTFANKTQYEIKKISKDKCVQNNIGTNFSRDVIRKPAYNYEKDDEKQKFIAIDKWYWINDKGDPKSIDDWLSKKLNNLQIGQTMRQRIHGSTYEFQKTSSDKGQQKNMKTGKTRVITCTIPRKVKHKNTRGKSQSDNEDQYKVNIKVKKKRCKTCDGVGIVSYSDCNECDGTGYEQDDVYNNYGINIEKLNTYGVNIEKLNNYGVNKQKCSKCDGDGVTFCYEYGENICSICGGKGYKLKKPKIEKYDDEQDYYDSKNNNVSDDDVNDKYVSNPVIINIGISQYKHITNLPGVKPDVKNWNNLWYNVYGFKKIYDNQNEPGLTHDVFWEICLRARKRLCSETYQHDGLIFSFSGHGDTDTLCMSDCNPKTNKGLIKINDVINYFSGHNVKSRILKCPRILILDKCRGGFDSEKDLVIDKTRGTSRASGGKIHPMENVRVLYANTSGYTTADTKRGGYLTSSFTDVFSKANGKIDFDKLVIKVKQRVSKISKAGNCVEDKNMMLFNFYLKPKGGYSYGSRGIIKLQKSGTTASK